MSSGLPLDHKLPLTLSVDYGITGINTVAVAQPFLYAGYLL
jgi:hypothetical protein